MSLGILPKILVSSVSAFLGHVCPVGTPGAQRHGWKMEILTPSEPVTGYAVRNVCADQTINTSQ